MRLYNVNWIALWLKYNEFKEVFNYKTTFYSKDALLY